MSGNATVVVSVLDQIDTPPYFNPAVVLVDVLENATLNHVVYKLEARDEDINDAIHYVMTNASKHSGMFELNAISGELKLAKPLDREMNSSYRLEFRAVDLAGLTSSANGGNLVLTVNVIDVNDHKPEFVTTRCQTEVTFDYPNKSIIFILNALDKDAPGPNSAITYSLSSNTAGVLTIDNTTGVITKTGDFSQFITNGALNFVAHVSDNGAPKLTQTLACTVEVLPVNDKAPKFPKTVYALTVREDFSVGNIIETYQATGNSALTYSLLGGQDLFKIYPQNVRFNSFLCYKC